MKIIEVTINNDSGAGAVPYNKDVDYFGLRVEMKPSTFLKLAAPLGQEHSAELEKYIADGGAIGSPFLEIKIPQEWDDGDFSKPAQVAGHEGRNRMTAVQKLEGDNPIEVHIFPRGGYRARDLTADYVKAIQQGMLAEKSTNIIPGPLFGHSDTGLTEGGWASVETQNTVITPAVLAEAVEVANKFAVEFNEWQAKQQLDLEIKMGRPKGSGTYYERDLKQDPAREYGDIDIECFIHSAPGTSSAQRIAKYKSAITEFALSHPDYSTENGTNITMNTSAGPVQVDLIYTYHEHANWSRALSPEDRVKGVISTSLTSALAEVLNLSFSTQGLQVKTRGGQPVSFRQSKDTQLHTVSLDPENWAADIYKFYYTLINRNTPSGVPADLKVHSGLKDEQRLSDIVLSIKSLANAFDAEGMFGQGPLAHINSKQDMMTKISSTFANKLEAVITSSKFDKAATPAAIEKADKTKLMLAKYRNEITKLLLN
jgi:hypothetical protein